MFEIRSRIAGDFTGYDGDAIFQLENGQVWQQKRHRYYYRYRYRPAVRVYREGNRHFMEVDCMNEPIEVVQASIVVEGQIISAFRGFGDGATFEFSNGSVWQQAEHKHVHHHAHRPSALIVEGSGGFFLCIDGMSDRVRVRRVR